MEIDLTTRIGPLKLKNPVMVASGTFGYGEEFHDSFYDISRLGAVVTKGISLKPRVGNPMPRTVEIASGMINAIGLANVGLDIFLKEKLPFLEKTDATVVVNVFGETLDDYEEIAGRLEEVDGVAAIELNISCPNVGKGGLQFGADAVVAAKLTKKVRRVFSRAVIVKLPPFVSDIAGLARTIADAGADAVTLINTIPAMAIDAEAKRPVLGNVTGGLSGPAIKGVALKIVYDVARVVDIPVIGVGGIMTATDAIEFLLAGAGAVQVGTANFVQPMAALEIIEGLEKYCCKHGHTSVKEVIGALEMGVRY